MPKLRAKRGRTKQSLSEASQSSYSRLLLRNDMRDYRTFPRASEANMPPKQKIAKMMNDVFMLSWKSE